VFAHQRHHVSSCGRQRPSRAERKALRSKGTFAELAQEFVERYAKKKNKAWRQPEALVRKHVLPRWTAAV
jgi:hypothetical protein